MTNEQIIEFYNEILPIVGDNYKVIVKPGENDLKAEWIEYDSVAWIIENGLNELVNKLLENHNLNFEEKFLEIYKYIAFNYVYDDNVLYFFKKRINGLGEKYFIAADFYGRVVDTNWFLKRQTHNRRICYEFSRFFAEAINKIAKHDNVNIEACMVGDKTNNHYVVGLYGVAYSALVDIDDFNKIKDLTRLKLGLTLEGITIIRDNREKLSNAIKSFNKDKLVDLNEVVLYENQNNIMNNFVAYIEHIINVLKPYQLDPQGFMEYLKSKIESNKIDIDKIWRRILGEAELRHVRCLVFEYDSKKYLIDTFEQNIKDITEENIDENKYVINSEEHYYEYFGG